MKQILLGIVILVLLGVGGFLYRNAIEKPTIVLPGTATSTGAIACTAEARVCPDGSAVGRTGPNCSLAACPPPNVELNSGSTTVSFVLPAGYQKSTNTGGDQTLLASYTQSSGQSPSTILVHLYPIPTGKTADQVIVANTTFDPSGMQATSTAGFAHVTQGRNTFLGVVIGRFEGQVQHAYYLPVSGGVLRFDIVERGVNNWTDPTLNVNNLPQNQTLLHLLATVQVS